MAYPYPIASDIGDTFLSWTPSVLGPFLNGTARYVIVIDDRGATQGKIRTYKSTDLGQTWTVQDAADGPEILVLSSNYANCGVTQSGTTLYVSFYGAASLMAVARFSMATDQWLSEWGYVGVGGPTTSGSMTLNGGGRAPSQIFARSDGTFLVVYGDNAGGSTGADSVKAFTVSALGVFGSPFTVMQGTNGATSGSTRRDFSMEGAVLMSSDAVWCFAIKGTYPGPTLTIELVIVESDNTITPGIGTYQVSTTVQTTPNVGRVGMPKIHGTEVWLPFVRRPGASNLPYVTKAAISTPTSWTEQQIDSSFPLDNGDLTPGLAIESLSASKGVAAWWGGGFDDVYRAIATSGVWASPDVILASDPNASSWGMSIRLIGARYGIVTAFNAGGPGLYFEFDVPSGEAANLNRGWIT